MFSSLLGGSGFRTGYDGDVYTLYEGDWNKHVEMWDFTVEGSQWQKCK